MSDPVTNVEIEDVLASIRRLVSEDVRVRPMAPASAPAPVAKPIVDRLVLTPALRVMETQEEAEEASAPEAEKAVWGNPEARLADVWPEDQPIPAAPEPKAKAHVVAEEVVEEADGESVEEALFLHVETPPEADMHQWFDADQPAQPAEEAEMAEEPAESEVYAATAGDEDEAIEDLLSEEAVIDEAALREMVAEIVRQELMGALGERITRNVRKLVRREIHRALSAQDFE